MSRFYKIIFLNIVFSVLYQTHCWSVDTKYYDNIDTNQSANKYSTIDKEKNNGIDVLEIAIESNDTLPNQGLLSCGSFCQRLSNAVTNPKYYYRFGMVVAALIPTVMIVSGGWMTWDAKTNHGVYYYSHNHTNQTIYCDDDSTVYIRGVPNKANNHHYDCSSKYVGCYGNGCPEYQGGLSLVVIGGVLQILELYILIPFLNQ